MEFRSLPKEIQAFIKANYIPRTKVKDFLSPYLKDARTSRDGEEIGGGFFIFRRGETTKRIKVKRYPFEHPSIEAAEEEVSRLNKMHPEHEFEIYARVTLLETPVINKPLPKNLSLVKVS